VAVLAKKDENFLPGWLKTGCLTSPRGRIIIGHRCGTKAHRDTGPNSIIAIRVPKPAPNGRKWGYPVGDESAP
jgi:hypothetical protein